MIDPQALRSRADHILELHETGLVQEALDACAGLLDEAEAADLDHEVVRESVFTARFEQGVLLTELGDLEAAATGYASAAATPTDLDDPDQRHELAMALLNQGICLDTLGDPGRALDVYDRLVVRLGDADDPVTVDQVVRARVNRAAAMLALGRPAEALTVAEALQGELDPTDLVESEQRSMATRLRAAALLELGHTEQAAEVLGDVERCSDEEPAARRQVVAAVAERARLLRDLDRQDEALEMLERTVRRYQGEQDPEVAEVVVDLVAAEAEVLEHLGEHDRAARLRHRVGG